MLEVPSNTKLTDQEIQAAIWQLADPNLTFPNAPSGFSLTQVNTFENDAKANPLTSGFEVLYGFRQQVSGIRCLDSRAEHV